MNLQLRFLIEITDTSFQATAKKTVKNSFIALDCLKLNDLVVVKNQ